MYLTFPAAGDIHIWDRESAALLHHIRPQAVGGGDLTCIAWNPAADPFMFATGSHDGGVKIWTPLRTDGMEDLPPSRAPSTHPAPTPRTASPSLFDTEYRTESPSTTEFQVESPVPSAGVAQDALGRERAVTFLHVTPPS